MAEADGDLTLWRTEREGLAPATACVTKSAKPTATKGPNKPDRQNGW